MKTNAELPQQTAPIVYVVDDDADGRTSLRWLVGSVGLPIETFASAAEFLESYRTDRPSCLVLDIRMPGMGGLELQSLLRDRQEYLPIIFMTGHGDIPMSVRAIKNGAFDFLEKPFNSQVMLEVIQAALKKACLAYANDQIRCEDAARLETLSKRERQVLDLLVDGLQGKQVAHELNISLRTVEIHRANIRQKLGTDSLAKIVQMVLAYRTN